MSTRTQIPPSGPDPGDAELIAGEMFANAVLHTRSGHESGTVTVAVTPDVADHRPGVLLIWEGDRTEPRPTGMRGRPNRAAVTHHISRRTIISGETTERTIGTTALSIREPNSGTVPAGRVSRPR